MQSTVQKADAAAEEARRRKDREEILLSISRILDQIKDERDAFERRLDQKNRETTEQMDKVLKQRDDSSEKAEEKLSRVQRETVYTLQKIEEKLDETMAKVDKKVDMSAKAIQTMMTVAIFGFTAVTLSVVVLFFTLLTNL